MSTPAVASKSPSPLQSRGASSPSVLARMRASTAAVMEDDRARRARAEEVVAYAGRRVAVTGAVRRPVVFMWDDRVTVLDAIAIARGPRPGASRAVVLRHTPEGLREIHVLLDDESTVTLSPGDEVRVLAA